MDDPALLSTGSVRQQAQAWLDSFARTLAARDVDGACALFEDSGYWRDLVAFSWNIITSLPLLFVLQCLVVP